MSLRSSITQMRNAKMAIAVCAIFGFFCMVKDLESQGLSRELRIVDLRKPEKIALCIITSAYGDDAESVDIPLDATKYAQQKSEDVRFFYFTNTEASKIETPGWTKIIEDLPQFKSRIVQSRWPKFQAFKHPTIQRNCRTIMYMDSSSSIEATMDEILAMGIVVRAAKAGFAQARHILGRASITEEFTVINRTHKDTIEHVHASLEWMKNQKDWKDDVTIYQNNHFWYDPFKPHVVEMMDFFWERYSQELDSWRDQPLWAYTLHHFKFTPIVLERYLIGYATSRMHNGHQGYADAK